MSELGIYVKDYQLQKVVQERDEVRQQLTEVMTAIREWSVARKAWNDMVDDLCLGEKHKDSEAIVERLKRANERLNEIARRGQP